MAGTNRTNPVPPSHDATRLAAEIANEPQWIVWSDAVQESDWIRTLLLAEWSPTGHDPRRP